MNAQNATEEENRLKKLKKAKVIFTIALPAIAIPNGELYPPIRSMPILEKEQK